MTLAARLRTLVRGAGEAVGERKTAMLGAGGTIMFSGLTGRDAEIGYAAASRRGYMQNPVVHRAVRLIAENAAAVPLLLYDGAREVDRHPILDLLRQRGGSGRPPLVEAICGHLLLAGNAYLLAGRGDDLSGPAALHALRPDRVRIVEDGEGWPHAYEYRVGSTVRRFAAEGEDGRPGQVLHLSLFHPLADGEGLAPAAAAAAALELHNAAGRWNLALIENSARPSGALVYQPGDGANLSPDQFDRLKTELESGYAGAARAGRPMLLEGGLDWKAMALSPKDMDFIEAKNQAARDIAIAFGVPPMLLGVPGEATFANYAEANRALWRLTILPLLTRLTGEVGDFLARHFDSPGLRLSFDADRIEGLALEREALWSRIDRASFLSADEKREAVGYGPARGANREGARGDGEENRG